MPAIGSPSTLPAGVPVAVPPPQRVPPAPRKAKPWTIWLLAALILGGAWVAYQLLRKPQTAQQGAIAPTVRTAKLFTGTLDRVLRLSGETAAKNYASITVPIMRGPDTGRDLVLVKLAAAGSFVKKGDVVAQIDAQGLRDHIDDVNSLVVQAEADIKKRRAEQAIDRENLQQTLTVAKAELDKAKLDYSAAEVRTPIDQELLKLAVEEADARDKELQKEIAEKQTTYKAELRILEITRQRQVMHRDRHVSDLKRTTFRAPMNGLVVMQNFFRGGEMSQVQLGDQVRSGQTFMKIVDTSSMMVETSVNQATSGQLRLGQPATISLDAFPGLRLHGEIYSLGAMGVHGWMENYYIRNIPVRIQIKDSDPRLIPDLSASADVLLEQKDNVLLLPLGAVHSEKGKSVVYIKKGDRFGRRNVRLGIENEIHAEVLSGLEAGDIVALDRPSTLSAALR